MERPRRVRIVNADLDSIGPTKVILVDPKNGDRLGEVVSVEIPRVDPGDTIIAKITVLGPELDLIVEASITEECRYCGAKTQGAKGEKMIETYLAVDRNVNLERPREVFKDVLSSYKEDDSDVCDRLTAEMVCNAEECREEPLKIVKITIEEIPRDTDV